MSRQRPNVQTRSSGSQGEAELRLPPHDEGAERGVLGCCLTWPAECLPQAVAAFHGHGTGNGPGEATVWYHPLHRLVFGVMAEMQDQLEAVDVITLWGRVKARTDYDPTGGWMAWLSGLGDVVPSGANLPAYLEVVWAHFLRRKMLWALGQASERVMNYSGSPGQVGSMLDRCEAEVLEVQRLGEVSATARGMAAIVADALHAIDEMRRGVGLILGIRTHFGHLDKWTAGLHRKQVTIVAARPSLGKTALALCIAENIAEKERLGVGVFSMEMEDIDLIVRMLCKDAEVDSHKLRTGFASHADLDRMPATGLRLSKLPIWIDGTPALGILELKARARRLVSEHKVSVIVVDYIQLMRGSHDWNGNRALELGEISSGLKAIGKELNVAMLVLAQLNRETEKAKFRKPQLSDLRDSGAIEQDADTVLMLYLPKCEENEDDEAGNPAEVLKVNALIAKQRHGPRDWDVEFAFHRRFTRFEDAYGNRGHELPTQPEGREGQPRMDTKGHESERAMPTNEEMGLGGNGE